MARKNSKKQKGRGRRHNRNGNSSGAYERSVVRRQLQYVSNLTVPTNASTAIGSINWSAVTAVQEFKELSDLYAQCRITRVTTRFSPQSFHPTSSPTYVPIAGCVAHDVTSQGVLSTPASWADFAMMTPHRLWASSGMGSGKWMSLSYRAPLTNAQDFGNTAETFAPGQWASSQYYGNVAGTTYYSVMTQNGVTNTTLSNQVLQVIQMFSVEFREPIPDRGAFNHTNTIEMKMCTVSDSKDAVCSQKEEKKVARPTLPSETVCVSSQGAPRMQDDYFRQKQQSSSRSALTEVQVPPLRLVSSSDGRRETSGDKLQRGQNGDIT